MELGAGGGPAGGRDPSLSFLPPEAVESARPDVPGGPGDVTCEVVVIGAGVAGLTAAHELLRRDPNTKVCVVEANGESRRAVLDCRTDRCKAGVMSF